MALDATVGGAASNAFQTRESAAAIISDRIGGLAFVALSGPIQDTYNVTATRIFNSLEYTGIKATEAQRLQFPMLGLFDRGGYPIPSTIIPDDLKEAHAELMFSLWTNDTSTVSIIGSIGLTELKAGSVGLKFKDSITFQQLPDNVLQLIPPGWLVLATPFPFVFETVGAT